MPTIFNPITSLSSDGKVTELDDLAHTAIELRVRLRYCGSKFCVSVNEKKGGPYTIIPGSASESNPLTVKPGDNIHLDPIYFNI